jgi:outer membrane protein OmpA-like peptidoglycan-associated protein
MSATKTKGLHMHGRARSREAGAIAILALWYRIKQDGATTRPRRAQLQSEQRELSNMLTLTGIASILALTLAAEEPQSGAGAEGSLSFSTDKGADADGKAKGKGKPADQSGTPWIKRYRPERMMMELGVFGGIMLPSKQHEFYDPVNPWQPYAKIVPDVGLRFGFYPLRVFGIEAEGAVMPGKTDDGVGATLFGARGYLLAQLPYRIAPFALAGIGMLGGSGASLGTDIDPVLHFGGGVKFFINRLVALRLDVRNNVSAARGLANGRTNNLEFLLGLSITLGRKKVEEKPLIDTDGDGLYDPGQGLRKSEEDNCPNEPGPRSNQGCPLIDSDGDGLWDPGQGAPANEEDKCPNEPGPRETQGCPLKDSDGDGLYDPGQGLPEAQVDKCPNEPGPRELQGCPPKDTDGDGFFDPGQGLSPEDKCPAEPESFNGYQDGDGCPDEVPANVKKFTGVVKGINFDVDKDTIRPNSKGTLDSAVKVLKEFDVKIEISGHTDSDGAADHNRDLSKRRAEAVKKYLVDNGIDAGRITTVGYGPDKPIADNKTKRGKAENRRIEFRLLTGELSK